MQQEVMKQTCLIPEEGVQQELARDPLANSARFVGGLNLETIKETLAGFYKNDTADFMSGFGFEPLNKENEYAFYHLILYPGTRVGDFCREFKSRDPKPVLFQSVPLQMDHHEPLYYFLREADSLDTSSVPGKALNFHCISLPRGLAPAVTSMEIVQ